MTVRLRADEVRDSAKEHLKDAILDLLELVNPNTSGHNEFKKDYITSLFDVIKELRSIKEQL